jgi:NAD(P)-dependent dehydrogenase (short-subunit alcohol dehydrogenase family)
MALKGKTALVTGAAGNGLGRSIALTLAREGARVVVNYRKSADAAAEITEYIRAQGGEAAAVAADVFTAEGCQALVQGALDAFGQVDICIIGPGGEWHPQPIEAINPTFALECIQRETAPIMHLMPLVLPGMFSRGWGRLIGIGTHPVKLSPAYTYNAGKLARMQALLLAQDQAWGKGVTVNVIAPGPVNGIASFDAAAQLAAHGTAWQERKNVTPQDVAEGVAFLCSDAGDYVTGCTLPYLFH